MGHCIEWQDLHNFSTSAFSCSQHNDGKSAIRKVQRAFYEKKREKGNTRVAHVQFVNLLVILGHHVIHGIAIRPLGVEQVGHEIFGHANIRGFIKDTVAPKHRYSCLARHVLEKYHLAGGLGLPLGELTHSLLWCIGLSTISGHSRRRYCRCKIRWR